MMNANREPLGTDGYARVWAAAFAAVLTRASGAAVDAELLAPAHADGQVAAGGLWLRYRAGGALAGEQAMALAVGDAVTLAQLRLGEPPDRQAELTPERAAAVAALAGEWAAAAVAALAEQGIEATFDAGGSEPLAEPAASFACRCSGESLPPLAIAAALDGALARALGAAPEPQAAAAPEPAPEPAAASPEPQPQPSSEPPPAPRRAREDNLDLLLDVPLDVSLRFGGRRMILKEILELGPGAVVELDRGVQDPVELLVAGRVVAQGEVVIVDGNYGLRVTEIAAPRHRLTSLAH